MTSSAAVPSSGSGAVLALLLGLASLIAYFWKRRLDLNAKKTPANLPEDGIFTLMLLDRFNGVTGPLCMGVCGKVIDVSSSENITVGEGYGKLWAGRDATYSLATLSLKPEHANILDYKLEQFTPEQHKALAGWYKHFTTKYKVVGRLKEYDGWDFSSIEKEAESQTPFGVGKVAEPSEEKETNQEPADDRVILRAGDQVVINGLENKKELNGAIGELKSFNVESGRFAVQVPGHDKPILLKPSNLTKAET